jgi:hypothetical protein
MWGALKKPCLMSLIEVSKAGQKLRMVICAAKKMFRV